MNITTFSKSHLPLLRVVSLLARLTRMFTPQSAWQRQPKCHDDWGGQPRALAGLGAAASRLCTAPWFLNFDPAWPWLRGWGWEWVVLFTCESYDVLWLMMVVLKTDSFHVLLPRCCRPPLCSSSTTVHWSLEPVAYPRCLLEFDAHIARQAVDVHDLAAAIEGSLDLLAAGWRHSNTWLLWLHVIICLKKH